MTEFDTRFMRRAIELARYGLGQTSPNPMVGAVVVHAGNIIGEGYHRRCGEGHAEVNAIASVKDKSLLKDSTIYVTLEPCSHYGKTPPCSRLIIEKEIPRVVIGSLDPFKEVSGRGVDMLRSAGCQVETGCLEEECKAINPMFMTAHTHGRPWVTLKWARSADGFIDRTRMPDERPTLFSNPLTLTLSHRLRSLHDAIMIGSGTWIADKPSLTTRLWPGRTPARVLADRHNKISPQDGWIHINTPDQSVADQLKILYRQGVTSVLVEGGSKLLNSFIDSDLWDAARVEVTPVNLQSGVASPVISDTPQDMIEIGVNKIFHYGRIPWFMI